MSIASGAPSPAVCHVTTCWGFSTEISMPYSLKAQLNLRRARAALTDQRLIGGFELEACGSARGMPIRIFTGAGLLLISAGRNSHLDNAARAAGFNRRSGLCF